MLVGLNLSRVQVTTITPGNSDSNDTTSTNRADSMRMTSWTKPTIYKGPRRRNALDGLVIYNHIGQLKVIERDSTRGHS